MKLANYFPHATASPVCLAVQSANPNGTLNLADSAGRVVVRSCPVSDKPGDGVAIPINDTELLRNAKPTPQDVAALKARIKELHDGLDASNAAVQKANADAAQATAAIATRDATIAERDKTIADLKAELAGLNKKLADLATAAQQTAAGAGA